MSAPRTTVVTSNLDYEEWDQAFAVNRLLGSATLVRVSRWWGETSKNVFRNKVEFTD